MTRRKVKLGSIPSDHSREYHRQMGKADGLLARARERMEHGDCSGALAALIMTGVADGSAMAHLQSTGPRRNAPAGLVETLEAHADVFVQRCVRR